MELKTNIEAAWENRALLSEKLTRDAIDTIIESLDKAIKVELVTRCRNLLFREHHSVIDFNFSFHDVIQFTFYQRSLEC